MAVRSVAAERAVLAVNGRRVTVVPPQGLCIAGDAARSAADAVFVLIGACAGAAHGTAASAILTASVAPAGLFGQDADRAAELDRLEEFLGSERGLALVGRQSGGEAPRILETYREGELLLLLVEERGEPGSPIWSPRFWRAFLDLNGRMVSLTAGSLRTQPLGDREMLALLRDFIVRLREANGSPAPAPAVAG